LEKRLKGKKTIDQNLQEQINKEKDNWEKVLVRIITIVKHLSKNNLAFHGTNEKIYEKKNYGNFLSLIEMLVEFYLIREEHVKCIKYSEIRAHYLSNTIQNELIELLALQIKKVRDAKYFLLFLIVHLM